MPDRPSAKTPKGAAPTSSPARDGRTLRRQGEATRAKLLAAAEPALAENGWHATRVDDVVRLAGVSHGTFYLYFANKEDLFRALAERCADDAAELAASLGPVRPGPAGLAAVRAWVAEFLDFYRRNGVVIRAWAENQVGDRKLARLGTTSFGRISSTLRASMTGGGEPTREVEVRAAALLAMLERFAYVVSSRDLGLDDAAVVDNLALVVHRGFFSQGRPAQASARSSRSRSDPVDGLVGGHGEVPPGWCARQRFICRPPGCSPNTFLASAVPIRAGSHLASVPFTALAVDGPMCQPR